MDVNRTLEERLWKITRPNPLEKNEFVEIIDYLFGRLGAYLEQPLEKIGEDYMDEDAFSRSFRGAIRPTGAFKITFVGVLGMEPIGDRFVPHTSANLYLFGDHQRLTAGQTDRSFIYLEYRKDAAGNGNWFSGGWEIDEFDEYENITESEFR